MIVKNVEKKDEKNATFQIEVDSAEFEAALNKAYNKNKGSISVPGFRKGKAPRAIIENMYGAEVFYQDAIDEIAPEAFAFGYDNCGLELIGTPRVTNMDLSDEKVLTIDIACELYPEVTLGEYKNLSTTKQVLIVEDQQVEDEMQRILKRNARKIDVEREAQMGDTADIDFDGYLDGERFDGGYGEGFELELGSNTFVPGFEEQVCGMQIGEEKDVNITFPEDYAENLAGKDVVFKVKLNGLTVDELPELDDEFIQDISEFNTVDEYKADLRAAMEKNAQDQIEAKFRTDIMAMAADNMTVEVPETMIDAKEVELLRNYGANFGIDDDKLTKEELMKLMGLTDEAVEGTVRPAALYQVKQDLLLNAVVKAENIDVTEEETEEYIKGAAESVGAQPEDIVKYFGMDFIRSEYKKEKATRIIIESATVSEIVDNE